MATLETAKFKARAGYPNEIVWSPTGNRILTRFKDGITTVEGANKVKIMETLGYEKVAEKADKAEKPAE